VLHSPAVETGAQEIAAIVLASAVLGTERARGHGAMPVLRVRFGQVLNVVRSCGCSSVPSTI
jgi:hypothetical protein